MTDKMTSEQIYNILKYELQFVYIDDTGIYKLKTNKTFDKTLFGGSVDIISRDSLFISDNEQINNEQINHDLLNKVNTNDNKINQNVNESYYTIKEYESMNMSLGIDKLFDNNKKETNFTLIVKYNDKILYKIVDNLSLYKNNDTITNQTIKDKLTLIGNNYNKFIQTILKQITRLK